MQMPVAPREKVRYVRFEHASEGFHGMAFGPFSYIAHARDVLVGAELAQLEEIVTWFVRNLDEPARMVPFRDVGERRARRRRRQATAQCWFREDAREHIGRARELVAVLERAGFAFVERWSDRLPGKLCAEDGVQVAVVRYRDVGEEG
jgi:hypothetical protein